MKGKKCVVRFSNCQLFTKYSALDLSLAY